jgi:simple sugar transport system permease protein
MEFLADIGQLSDLVSSSLRLGTPIAFAALGGVLAERSGTYNIGLEGMILAGAFGAAAGSYATGSATIGLLCGVLCGLIGGIVLSVLSIRYRVNQLVAGIALNLVLAGMTAFLARLVFGDGAGGTQVNGFSSIHIPVLEDIPFLGPVLFNQDPLIYLLFVIATFGSWWMFRTNRGRELRAVGENPRAADAAGVPVFAIRYTALIASCGLASLGGCHLVLAQVYLFSEDMSSGKGFIALAAVILGRWSPVGALSAALFFGFCDALQLRLQFTSPEIPYQIFVILPYVASLIALVGFVGLVRAPASVGAAYDREDRG